jgi:hypothetical protein
MNATCSTELTIHPAAGLKDVYLLHNGAELVATIIEWYGSVEVRVTRKLDAEEHSRAMAFVGTLANRDCTFINYDKAEAIALAGGCSIEKESRPAVARASAPSIAQPMPAAVATTPRPRLILLPVDHECACDGSDEDPCPACQSVIARAEIAAHDRSAAAEYNFYEGMVA